MLPGVGIVIGASRLPAISGGAAAIKPYLFPGRPEAGGGARGVLGFFFASLRRSAGNGRAAAITPYLSSTPHSAFLIPHAATQPHGRLSDDHDLYGPVTSAAPVDSSFPPDAKGAVGGSLVLRLENHRPAVLPMQRQHPQVGAAVALAVIVVVHQHLLAVFHENGGMAGPDEPTVGCKH